MELNQNLRVNSVRDVSGKPVSYDRDDNSSLKLHVTLADTVPAGGKVTLFFDYGGPLSSRMNNPDQGVRMAYIAKDGGYLLLPSRWFPLTDFPSNRYTGIFQIEVPGTMTVVGTGKSAGAPESVTPKLRHLPLRLPCLGTRGRGAPVSPTSAPPPPSMENERMLYTYRVDKPEAAGTFVIAPLQLSPERAEGVTYSIYTPPASANTAPAYADAVSHVLDFYNDEFRRSAGARLDGRATSGWDGRRICRAGPAAGERAAMVGKAKRAAAGGSCRAPVVGRASHGCYSPPTSGSRTGCRATPRDCTSSKLRARMG